MGGLTTWPPVPLCAQAPGAAHRPANTVHTGNNDPITNPRGRVEVLGHGVDLEDFPNGAVFVTSGINMDTYIINDTFATDKVKIA